MSLQYSLEEVETICNKYNVRHYSLIQDYFTKNPDASNKENHLNLLKSKLNELINSGE